MPTPNVMAGKAQRDNQWEIVLKGDSRLLDWTIGLANGRGCRAGTQGFEETGGQSALSVGSDKRRVMCKAGSGSLSDQ
jgi:hypothetical protein